MNGRRMERLISGLLRGGVLISLVVILLGTLITFLHHPEYLSSTTELQRLTRPGAAVPQTVRDVLAGVGALDGPSIVALGLLLLMATPVLRVGVSIVGFALERDRLYVLITSTVLGLLILSLLLGRPGG
jgi:uncharacterized membrane protein